jgi:hypothetical protein
MIINKLNIINDSYKDITREIKNKVCFMTNNIVLL